MQTPLNTASTPSDEDEVGQVWSAERAAASCWLASGLWVRP